MKALSLSLASLFTLAIASSAYSCLGCVHRPFKPYTKTYIQPAQLGFSNEGIYVKIDNSWKQTSAVYADNTGIYFDTIRDYLCTTDISTFSETEEEQS